MNNDERILGLFYSDKDNLIYDKIKFSEDLSEENKNNLDMVSYKFLGPVFLTTASNNEENWKIELIESSLSHYRGKISDIIQSFFSLNSSVNSGDGVTNLFVLIGSPYTEDIKDINDILANYIHPSIIQGKIVNENLLGNRFNFYKFITSELDRGLHLIDYALGSSRKVYWEQQHKYSCVGVIERIKSDGKNVSNLYTYDENEPLRREALKFIPSYYVMCILPDYYETLIDETLHLFNKKSVFADIRLIHLNNSNNKVIYLEEFSVKNEIKTSYGVLLVQDKDNLSAPNKISFYRKNLRLILDGHKDINDILPLLNAKFKPKKWGTLTDEGLNNIGAILDNISN